MKKTELLAALEKVKPGLANKEIIEHSTSFAFVNGRVVTYNDEISVSYPLPGVELEGAVKADELYKFLSRIKTDEIELKMTENELCIKSGKAKIGLTLEKEIRLPLTELGKIGAWKPLPEDFLKTVEIVRFCCAKNMSKPLCTCVNIQESGLIEAFDNYRAIRFQIGKIPNSFLLPATAAEQIIKYPIAQMTTSEGWVHFTDKEQSFVFSCRVFAENFFDLSPFFVLSGQHVDFVFPAESTEILTRARIFSKTDVLSDEQVEIAAEGRRLFFRAKTTGGWFEEWAKIPDATWKTCMHPQFLQDILSLTTKCQIIPGVMIKFFGDNWEHVAQMDAGK